MSAAIDALDHEWQTYDRRRDVRRFMATLEQNPLLGYPTAASLVQGIRVTGLTDAARADLMLAELIARSRHEPVAQRIVLQALLPGLCNVIGRVVLTEHPSRRADVPAEIVSLVGLRIASYPIERRPRAIACNVLRDVERDYGKEQRRRLAGFKSLDDAIEPDRPAVATEDQFTQVDDRLDLVAFLGRARRAAVINDRDIAFLVETRVPDRAVDDVAVEQNVSADALRRARLRAESRLGRFRRNGLAA